MVSAKDSIGTLFVVATPIGNLGDLSPRAADLLRQVDRVVAEDTRRSRILLDHVGSGASLSSFHAHSRPERRREIVRWLGDGEDVALLTDAGTPVVSDPGGELVAEVRAADVPVVPVPGPSAVAVALSAAGLPADRYTFLGFTPRKGRARHDALQAVADSPWTVVLFEAANRLATLLADLAGVCGTDRRAVVARELTKVHEEVRAGTLGELRVYYDDRPPRGEITVVVAGGQTGTTPVDARAVEGRAREIVAAGVSRRDAAAQLTREFGISRNEAYTLITSL